MDEESEKIADQATPAAIFSFATFAISSGSFYYFKELTPIIFYLGVFILLATFGAFFIFDGFIAVFARSLFISVLFSLQYYVPYPMNWFIISVTLFHLGKKT